MTTVSVAAIDIGASSGRVILGNVGPDSIDLTEVHRFRNGPVQLPDGIYWDALGLYQDILAGLRTINTVDLRGVAIDAWAVDYGLLGRDGVLRSNPRHYRDPRTETTVAKVHEEVPEQLLHTKTGLQHLPFNTLYQLAAEPDLTDLTALLIPDLLGYWLSGAMVTEATNASTTGLVNVLSGEWDGALYEALGIPNGLFPEIMSPGQILGPLREQVLADIGADRGATLSTVGSHDTASAVLAVPADTERFAYISCGTWGLVGVELETPVLTEPSRLSNFTNERGVDDTIRYLRNVMGLWLLSESLRTWSLQGLNPDLARLLMEAGRLPVGGPRFDPDDPIFLPPGDIPSRIVEACKRAGQRPPITMAETVRCIIDTLARTFAQRIDEAESLADQPVDVVHIVGGGAKNTLLCQLVADETQRPVLAGPAEATAMGNIVLQARTYRALSGDRWGLRSRIRAATDLVTYTPRKPTQP